MKIIKKFLKGFSSLFHKETIKLACQNYKYSLALFFISLIIFYIISRFYISFFNNVLIKNTLFAISKAWIYFTPMQYLKPVMSSPLYNLFSPIILYLSYVSTLVVLSLFKGFILDPLSIRIQNKLGYDCPFKIQRTGFRHFLFNIFEELKMLMFTIFYVFALFFFILPYSSFAYTFLSYFVFIFINALIYLSYSFLLWGRGYNVIARISLKNPATSLGFGTSITLFLIIINYMINSFGNSHILFSIILALNSLIFVFGVISGTIHSVSYVKNEAVINKKKTVFAYIFETVVILCAVIVIITGTEIFLKSKTQARLLKCNYKIESASIKLKQSEDTVLSGLLKRFNIKTNPELNVKLKITNPTTEDIHIFSFALILRMNHKNIAKKNISGGVIKAKQKSVITFKLLINSIKLGVNSLKRFLSDRKYNFVFMGKFHIHTWIGNIPVVFKIAG